MALNDEWTAAYEGLSAFSDSNTRSCGAMAANHAMMEEFPVFRRLLKELEEETSARMDEPMAFNDLEEVVIPVVVHIVSPDPISDVSDAQVESQIDVLNEDFSATNADRTQIPIPEWEALSIDSGLRFQLADRDPSGASHPGITRTESHESFGQGDRMKFDATGGRDAWDSNYYLNIWVCHLGGLLGYAQFPGGNPLTDGVVITLDHFGRDGDAKAPYDKGRTGTHEVGHWLNLYHIWGDTQNCSGTDNCADTPNQQLPNYESPIFPSPSCGNAPNGDMFMNYMDYVWDDAMFMFTGDQITRMRTTIATIRSQLISSPGLSNNLP